MEKKPINFVVKSVSEAVKELNQIVEKGGYDFDFGINNEYVNHVTKKSDGTTETEKERVYRIIGFVNTYVGEELDEFNAVKEDKNAVKKEREEMNRTLNILNKSAFAPISILLLAVAIIALVFGVLTLVKVLPLPSGQVPIAIVLVIIGVLSLVGSFLLFFFRRKKKAALLEKKDEILKQDAELKAKEQDINDRLPKWYKDAIWRCEGNIIKNATQSHTFKK